MKDFTSVLTENKALRSSIYLFPSTSLFDEKKSIDIVGCKCVSVCMMSNRFDSDWRWCNGAEVCFLFLNEDEETGYHGLNVGTIDRCVRFTLHNMLLQAHIQLGSSHKEPDPRQEA